MTRKSHESHRPSDLSERRRVAQESVLSELGERAASNELQELFENAASGIADVLERSFCEVLELSPDNEHFELRAHAGWPDDTVVPTFVAVAQEGLAASAVQSGEPVVVSDWRQEFRFTQGSRLFEYDVISGLSVVIRGPAGGVWGVLAAYSTRADHFTIQDAQFVQAAANFLTLAIQRDELQRELLASRARERARVNELDTLLDSVPASVWIAYDPSTSEITGNRTAHEFLEVTEDSELFMSPAPTHCEIYENGTLLSPHQHPVQRAARGASVFGCELETRFTGGSRKVQFGNATPLYDDDGRPRGAIAAFVEITARRDAEEERERLHERLDAERRLMEQMIEKMPVGVAAVDASGKGLFRNRHVGRITGLPPAGELPLERRDVQSRSPEGWWYTPEQWPLSRALRDGEHVSSEEMEIIHPEGGTRIVSVSALPIYDADGHLLAAMTTFHDITERKRREQAARFLAEATDLLGSDLDYERTLERVTKLAVPRLADWCVVDILKDDGVHIRRFAAHSDPDKVDLAQRFARGRRIDDEALRGVNRVIRTGEAEWESEISDDFLVKATRDEEHLRIARQLGLRSYICMPIQHRGVVLGAFTLVSAESGPRDVKNDVRLAEELSSRIALALENADLYAQARREVGERQRAEQELQLLNEDLEARVAERTAEANRRAAQLRRLASELTETEQRERRRLAKVLHDHLQQLLVAGKLEVGSVRTGERDSSATALQRLGELLDQSIQQCRTLTVELSPPVLYEAGLVAGLEWLGRWMDDQHGLAVHLDVASDVDPIGEDLRVLLFEATKELLFNVVKHARVDGAEVAARRDPEGNAEIRVLDRGCGLDPEEMQCSDDREHFGLLSIRERVAHYGGALTVQSAPGEGTCMVLSVPGESAMRPQQVEGQRWKCCGSKAGTAKADVIRVVLADDHEIVRQGLANTLTVHEDIVVVGEAADGAAAIELVREIQPEVAVLDVTMPGVDGIEAARTITAEFPHIRVIGLSVHEPRDMAAAMYEAGVSVYINKAAAADQLVSAIREPWSHAGRRLD